MADQAHRDTAPQAEAAHHRPFDLGPAQHFVKAEYRILFPIRRTEVAHFACTVPASADIKMQYRCPVHGQAGGEEG